MARINRAIELLEAGQPIYYTGVHSGLTFENGKAYAQTWADYLMVELEHAPFDPVGLRAFVEGLAEGGPCRSGHRMPSVICTLPCDGRSRESMEANAWMVKQVLAQGVHGILLCHAESPQAVQVFVESARYPFQEHGVGEGLDVGRRGAGGQAGAAALWGISPQEYLQKADVWPLNPDGELLLGLKIENRRALANVEKSVAVPGIAFAEWGPGDMGMSFGHPDAHDPPYPPEMEDARTRVKDACDENDVFFLNGVRPDSVVELLDEGVMIGSATEEAADIGRKHTGRTLPW